MTKPLSTKVITEDAKRFRKDIAELDLLREVYRAYKLWALGFQKKAADEKIRADEEYVEFWQKKQLDDVMVQNFEQSIDITAKSRKPAIVNGEQGNVIERVNLEENDTLGAFKTEPTIENFFKVMSEKKIYKVDLVFKTKIYNENNYKNEKEDEIRASIIIDNGVISNISFHEGADVEKWDLKTRQRLSENQDRKYSVQDGVAKLTGSIFRTGSKKYYRFEFEPIKGIEATQFARKKISGFTDLLAKHIGINLDAEIVKSDLNEQQINTSTAVAEKTDDKANY